MNCYDILRKQRRSYDLKIKIGDILMRKKTLYAGAILLALSLSACGQKAEASGEKELTTLPWHRILIQALCCR